MKLENEILYYKPPCPYCQKVLAYMKRAGIECEMRNILEGGLRDELVKIGGKGQVPCLVINGEAMYESDDLIAYMKEKAQA